MSHKDIFAPTWRITQAKPWNDTPLHKEISTLNNSSNRKLVKYIDLMARFS